MDHVFSIDNYLSESLSSGLNSLNRYNNENITKEDENNNNQTYSLNDLKNYYPDRTPLILETELDAWQNWRLRKKLLEAKRKEYDKLRKAQEALENLKLEQKEREDKARKREYLERKRMEREMRKKEEIEENYRKLREIKHREIQQKELTKEKSLKIYEEWCEKKKAAEELKKLQLKEQKLKKELEAIVKKKKNEEEFKKWYEKTKNRPKSERVSYAIANGQYHRYYDWSVSPQPAYINPEPWKPVDIPPPPPVKSTISKKPSTVKKQPTKQIITQRPVRSQSAQPIRSNSSRL